MLLRTLIIDDEYLARKRLSTLLQEFNNISIIGECKNGNEAIQKIHLKEPDLIFLDIQMPDIDGFTVLSKLKKIPFVIFTTAYDNFAIKAFEINAVDYLLKPFDNERLQISIDRIKKLSAQKDVHTLEDKIYSLIKDYETKKSLSRKDIIIKNHPRDIIIKLDDITHFKSDGNYVIVYTEKEKHLYRITMNELFNNLSAHQFLRIHRSFIINKYYIEKINYVNNNKYAVKLKTGEEFISSRSYKKKITEYLVSLP